MLTEALDYLHEAHKDSFEIVIVDDGSNDGTSRVALDYARDRLQTGGSKIRVVRLEKNRGKGGAVTHVCYLHSVSQTLSYFLVA